MKNNQRLKWLMIPLLGLSIFVGLKLMTERASATKHPFDSVPSLTTDEIKNLSIEGDTPRDTVATLVAQVKELRNELQTTLDERNSQKTESERQQREQSIDLRIQHALAAEHQHLQQERDAIANDQQQTHGLMQDLQQRLDKLVQPKDSVELPIGLGLQEGETPFTPSDDVRWVEPLDTKPQESNATGTSAYSFATHQPLPTPDAIDAPATKAVYTVPANATLMGAVAMTALIGRVPVDGTVNDPYPFKVLIGSENLTANGIDLPGIAGAVVSGTATADWTLSCVRGQIRSITFVFQDGTIRTLPEQNANAQLTGASDSTGAGLGWISDPYGIPCVSGVRRSNAQQYLGSQALVTAAGAGAASLIKSSSGSAFVSNANGSLGSVGITGNEAMGRILGSGVQEMSQWVNKLYGQAFAAVYVAPGAKVAVHIEQPLALDYNPTGRKVDFTLRGSHVKELD